MGLLFTRSLFHLDYQNVYLCSNPNNLTRLKFSNACAPIRSDVLNSIRI
jgi:hypothetical protein